MLLYRELDKEKTKRANIEEEVFTHCRAKLRPQFPFSLFTIEIAFRKKKAKQKQKEASAAAVYL